jgi:pimeloyl-ACP methyl ester carboxylesterase
MRSRNAVAVMTLILAPQIPAQQTVPAPPGKLIDAGGVRLHINCTGPHHGPTVILIAGIGDFSFDWALVQPRVQTFGQVCSYDRAGMAWSDKDPAEPNMSHVAQQLVNLLESAHVPPPYILVGHSWGGAIARVAANLIPQNIAGMVLIDSTHEDEILGITVGTSNTAVRPRMLSAAEWDKVWNPPAPAPAAPGGPPSGPITIKARTPSIEAPYTHLPKQAQSYRLWALSRPRPIDGGDFRSDLMTLFASRGDRDYPLGDLPLIVITPTAVEYDAEPGFTVEQLREDHLRLQADLATLSTHGKQVFAKGSGHHVQLDAPAVVITAIQDLIQQTKRPGSDRP